MNSGVAGQEVPAKGQRKLKAGARFGISKPERVCLYFGPPSTPAVLKKWGTLKPELCEANHGDDGF